MNGEKYIARLLPISNETLDFMLEKVFDRLAACRQRRVGRQRFAGRRCRLQCDAACHRHAVDALANRRV